MYRSLSAVLAFQTFDLAYAVLQRPSRQTSPVENTPDGVNGWSPKPTQPPQIRGQGRYGAVHMNDLFKRDSSSYVAATCGWISADASDALVCGSGYACAYLTATAPQYFACCPTTNGNINWDVCYYYSTCHNYNSQSAPTSYSGGEIVQSADPADLWCAGNAPYCNTYFLSQSVGSTYQYLWCATTSTLIDVYDFTVPASGSGSSSQTSSSQQPQSSHTSSSQQTSSQPPSTSSYHTPDSSSTRPSSSLTSSSPAAGGTHTRGGHSSPGISFAGQSITSTSTSSPTAGSGGSKSNTGAIAGGVVGGVAGIALLGAAIGYLVYRKRKSRVEPMREVSIYSNNYSSPGYSNTGGYSNSGGYSNNGYSNPNHANSYSTNY